MEKRYCEVRGKRYESAEAYQTGSVCYGCAGDHDSGLCSLLGPCGIFANGQGIIWVECGTAEAMDCRRCAHFYSWVNRYKTRFFCRAFDHGSGHIPINPKVDYLDCPRFLLAQQEGEE